LLRDFPHGRVAGSRRAPFPRFFGGPFLEFDSQVEQLADRRPIDYAHRQAPAPRRLLAKNIGGLAHDVGHGTRQQWIGKVLSGPQRASSRD